MSFSQNDVNFVQSTFLNVQPVVFRRPLRPIGLACTIIFVLCCRIIVGHDFSIT